MKTYKTEVNGLDCLIGYLGKHETLTIHYVTFKIDQFICNFCPIHEIPEGKYIGDGIKNEEGFKRDMEYYKNTVGDTVFTCNFKEIVKMYVGLCIEGKTNFTSLFPVS